MKVLSMFLLVILVSGCTSKPQVDDQTSQKVTITGTRIERSETSPGPKLTMRLNKQNGSSNFMQALAGLQSLPQPKDIGDCKGLLSALTESNLAIRIVDKNNVVLESEHGLYQYSFDDNSCPSDET
ncbi:hypothetical protein K0J45_09625 [Shewanella alkalitolerans]|uniref:hypothetical protein n=1 Tax=Shewanella alkalitolerans TaxID=2864209 RepID=UPI001C660D4B|nr:hypothetical protein [Shewanella alkalitolerans]QYJ99426.1 hypothetical protein K0J45_09625 [Shewanella alkalitolerans]